MRELSERDVADFRERIGDAAATLYARGGDAAISMREIARAVDASPMGLYRYFEDRDAIIAYLRIRAFTRFAERLETAFAKGADPFARARAVGRAYLDFALENPGPDIESLPVELRGVSHSRLVDGGEEPLGRNAPDFCDQLPTPFQ